MATKSREEGVTWRTLLGRRGAFFRGVLRGVDVALFWAVARSEERRALLDCAGDKEGSEGLRGVL